MKKLPHFLTLIAFLVTAPALLAQKGTIRQIKNHKKHIETFRKQKDATYKIPEKTMFTPMLLKSFKGLKYFPVDYSYKVKAQLTKLETPPNIVIKTSTGKSYVYVIYGTLSFNIKGKPYKLNVYQDVRLVGSPITRNALFLPFTDATSGKETYVGGRYLVLDIPNGDTLALDFNLAYNPYCVYNLNHSCPIPPKENNLAVKILAGEKMYE